MEHRRRASDCGPACDSAERGLDPRASVVLAIEDASRDADSARLGPEKAQKSRVILGTGAILPKQEEAPEMRDEMDADGEGMPLLRCPIIENNQPRPEDVVLGW